VAPEQFDPKNQKTTLYSLYNSLVPQTISVGPEPTFQASVPPSKTFWLRIQPSKIASAPAPQPCYVIGSFILAQVAEQFIVRLKLFSKGTPLDCPLSIGLECKSNVLYKSIAWKTIQSDVNDVSKNI